MNLSGEVKQIALENDTPWGRDDYVIVTVKLNRGGDLTLRLPEHRAKAYTLGRVVDVTAALRKK